MNEVTETLTKARALIEKGWTQGEFARDANGKVVMPSSAKAVCYCSFGAMRKAFPDFNNHDDQRYPKILEEAEWYFSRAVSPRCPTAWNDDPGRTQEEVLAAFDRAIELAKAETDGAS